MIFLIIPYIINTQYLNKKINSVIYILAVMVFTCFGTWNCKVLNKISIDYILVAVQNFETNYFCVLLAFIMYYAMNSRLNKKFVVALLVCLFLLYKPVGLYNCCDFAKNLPLAALTSGISSVHPMLITANSVVCAYHLLLFFINFNGVGLCGSYWGFGIIKLLYISISLSLFTGSYWSFQEVGWGGWWSWDFVEILLLNNFFIIIRILHTRLQITDHIKVVFLYSFCFFFFIFLVKYNIINSIHNFIVKSALDEVLIYYFIGCLSVVLLYVKKNFFINLKLLNYKSSLVFFLINASSLFIKLYIFINLLFYIVFGITNFVFYNMYLNMFYIILYNLMFLNFFFIVGGLGITALFPSLGFLDLVYAFNLSGMWLSFKSKKVKYIHACIFFYIYASTSFLKNNFFKIYENFFLYSSISSVGGYDYTHKLSSFFVSGCRQINGIQNVLYNKQLVVFDSVFSKYYNFSCSNSLNYNYKLYKTNFLEVFNFNILFFLVFTLTVVVYFYILRVKGVSSVFNY